MIAVVALVAACGGSGSSPGPAPAAGTPPAAEVPLPPVEPAPGIDFSHWKLTLPSGSEILTDQLLAGYALDEVFYRDAAGGQVFRCPNLAGTTANSSYSRTELREMLAPGGSAKADANNWIPELGGTLRASLRVDAVSTTGDAYKMGRVIIGQIHGPDTEPLRLYYDKKPYEPTGRIYAAYESLGGSTRWSPDIVPNDGGAGIELGETFSYEITMLGTLVTVVITQAPDKVYTYAAVVDAGYLGLNQYFKAGVYNQNNTGSADDYVQATFWSLEQRHP